MRRSAYLAVALAAVASLLVASVGVAGASAGDIRPYVPTARAEDPDDDGGSSQARKTKKEETCPQDKWVVALPVEGLACILLLPKPPAEGEDGGDGGGSPLGELGGFF